MSEWMVEYGGHDYSEVWTQKVCVLQEVLSDSLKLYLVQVKAGADVREGQRLTVEWEERKGSNTSVQVVGRLSALS